MLLKVTNFLVLCLFAFQIGRSQEMGTLEVSVTDPSGVAMPKASIELYRAVPDGYSGLKQKVPWKNGESVTFGDYELRISHPGMKSSSSQLSIYESRKGIIVGLEVGRISSYHEVSVGFTLGPELQGCDDLVLTPAFLTGVERRRERVSGGRSKVLGLTPGDYVAFLYNDRRMCTMQYVSIRASREEIVLRRPQ